MPYVKIIVDLVIKAYLRKISKKSLLLYLKFPMGTAVSAANFFRIFLRLKSLRR